MLPSCERFSQLLRKETRVNLVHIQKRWKWAGRRAVITFLQTPHLLVIVHQVQVHHDEQRPAHAERLEDAARPCARRRKRGSSTGIPVAAIRAQPRSEAA